MDKSLETINKQLEELKAGTEQILPIGDLEKKLASGKKLRIKLGMDPTAPDLHLGHAVVLSKLRQFQDFGHDIIFLIGDFTARIGDPTGKSKTRPALTEQEILNNTKTYFEQVSRILNPEKLTVCYNSQWLDKLTSKEFVKLCSKVTLSRLTEREDFASRIKNKQSIGFHELLYPLLQGYDSVALESDVELGGTDQTFNLLMGRYLQEQYLPNFIPQTIITVPILEGLDGIAKMSKSLGNAIGLTEDANTAYGKLMSISDELMWRYYNILLHVPDQEIKNMQEQVIKNQAHPMQLKKEMAYKIISRFWSEDQAEQAQKVFQELFQNKNYAHATEINLKKYYNQEINIVELLKLLQAVSSSSQARRLVESGAISVNKQKILEYTDTIKIVPNLAIKVGKYKFYRII